MPRRRRCRQLAPHGCSSRRSRVARQGAARATCQKAHFRGKAPESSGTVTLVLARGGAHGQARLPARAGGALQPRDAVGGDEKVLGLHARGRENRPPWTSRPGRAAQAASDARRTCARLATPHSLVECGFRTESRAFGMSGAPVFAGYRPARRVPCSVVVQVVQDLPTARRPRAGRPQGSSRRARASSAVNRTVSPPRSAEPWEERALRGPWAARGVPGRRASAVVTRRGWEAI